MSKRTTIRLIPPLQDALRELAAAMGVSYNQLVNYALTRFVETERILAKLQERASRGTSRDLRRALRKADRRSVPPDDEDRLPEGYDPARARQHLRRARSRSSRPAA
jgi:hypothetical protein